MRQMVNIVLGSILVNEVIGPPLTKIALERSGSTRRRQKGVAPEANT
jgi:hypothetical protein